MILLSSFPEVRNSTPICVLCSVMYREFASLVEKALLLHLDLGQSSKKKA